MNRPVTRSRKSPRKSALAKAALRSASSNNKTSHPVVSRESLNAALAGRPKVNFNDPFMRYAAMQAKGISLCAFLVTLAAFQRGLKVTFHYERASFDPRFAKAKMQGHRGELFSISNGTRTHTFSRTLGDLTDPTANAIAEDKHLTKAALKRAGVRTPEGIVVDKSQTALVEKFLAQHPGKRFVVKPHDGSLGKDVHANLASNDVISAVNSIPNSRVIVEEFVQGTEYRVTVVVGRHVAAYAKTRANVVGDGNSTIRQLIAQKNQRRAANPRLHEALIKDIEKINSFLKKKDLSLESRPQEGEMVFLTEKLSILGGGDTEDVTACASPSLFDAAVKASAAIGIVSAGLDMILSDDGDSAVPYILEINQRPRIGSHSFPMEGPGQGNAVAEAIIDYYFPETIRDRTQPNLAYDFVPIRTALESAQLSELSLPVIGPDWNVVRFSVSGVTARSIGKLIETAARATGVFVMSAAREKTGLELCIAYAPNNWQAFLNLLPAQLRVRFEKLAAEAT